MFCYYFALKLKGKLDQYSELVGVVLLEKVMWIVGLEKGIYTIVARVNSDPAFCLDLIKFQPF